MRGELLLLDFSWSLSFLPVKTPRDVCYSILKDLAGQKAGFGL